MREREVRIPGDVELAAVLCLPETASGDAPVPALALLAGTGADTRDGDLVLEGAAAGDPPRPGTMRQIAHRLAGGGVASLRWDKRGFGASGGNRAAVDYDTDLADAHACVEWLRGRPEIDAGRLGVAGHSAGALTACHLCRDLPGLAAAALLGALSSPIEDMLRWNVGRLRRHWEDFTPEQREWLGRRTPNALARAEAIEELLEAARRGEPAVRIGPVEWRTARLRQDLATDYAAEMRHVRCPVLVLHGGADLNVPVEDALRSYRELRRAANDDVRLVVLPGLDHYFIRVPDDFQLRVWERVSQQGLRRPMAADALDQIAGWAAAVLAP